MSIVAIDIETAYSQEYSLTRMGTAEYILDRRFEFIGAAVKEGLGKSEWVTGKQALAERLARIDWSRAALLSHNTRFDGAALCWHLGIRPALFLDTLSMARAMTHSITGRSSLDSVAAYLGLGRKGSAVHKMRGKWLMDFTLDDLAEYADYAMNDNDLCRAIFDRLMPKFPNAEIRVIDLALRAFIYPTAVLDKAELITHGAEVERERNAMYERVAHIPRENFGSNPKFAALLESYGVEVPMKVSPATGKLTYALARGDRAFKELCEDPDLSPDLQAIMAARLGTKSTIEATRTARLITLATASPQAMPVPLRYCAAHTTRFGGDDGLNFQNIRRKSRIRAAIKAPPGHVIVVRDSSQIEARMNAWMAREMRLLEDFRAGVDVYSKFATVVFGYPINKKDHPIERFIGKTGVLGLGYGCGHSKFRHMLFIGSGGQNATITEEHATNIVYAYRRTYPNIKQLWADCDSVLAMMVHRATNLGASVWPYVPSEVRPLRDAVSLGNNTIWLPSGLPIHYANLRVTTDDQGQMRIVYGSENRPPKLIYGAKVVENICQGLARVVITDIMRRVWADHRMWPMLQVHDSLAYVVREPDAAAFNEYLSTQFAIPPDWAPDLPLASEGNYGHTLAAAEGN